MTGLKLAQRGTSLETSFVAPRATTGGIRLGVHEVETIRADAAGDLARMGRRKKRRVAPGETLVESDPLPPVGTTVRVAARALDGRHASALSPVVSLTVQSPPPAPRELAARLEGETIHLRWAGTIPPPPPTPSPSPGASPSPSPGAAVSPAPGTAPGPTTSPRPAMPAGAPAPSAGGPTPPASSPAPIPGAPAGPQASASPAAASSAAAPASPSPSPSPSPPTRGFLIYRRAEPAGAFGPPLPSVPLAVHSYEDKAVSLGQQWCYAVGTVVSMDPVIESVRSNEACVTVKDIVAPQSPAAVAAVGGPEGVEVSWSPSTETDLAGYRVYRRPADGGEARRLADVAPLETTWRDTAAEPGERYVYTVTAVDRAGNESPPSAPAPGGRR